MAISQAQYDAYHAFGVLSQTWYDKVCTIRTVIQRGDAAINPGDPDNVLDDVIGWNAFLAAIKPRLNALVAEETALKAAAIAALQAL